MFWKANAQTPTGLVAYYGFTGLDTTRPVESMETGEGQSLVGLSDAHADYRGQLRVDGGADKAYGDFPVGHVVHYAFGEVCFAEMLEGGIRLNSNRAHSLDNAFIANTPITSAVFNKKVYLFGLAQEPKTYDGYAWRDSPSATLRSLRPAFGVAGGNRLIVSGCVGSDTTLFFSRVNDATVFDGEEEPDSLSVLSAGRLDVANQLGTADWITGLAMFEQTKLCVFTTDTCLVYQTDPDLTKWSLDDRSTIHVGCVSHNTIAEADTDVLFCSRYGVHAIRRSERNGIMVYPFEMSHNVKLIYRTLYSLVEDPTRINAVWSPDEGQYHIFFPTSQGNRRLTMTIPNRMDGEEAPVPTWSTGSFLNASCGASLSGAMHWGTPAGVWRMRSPTEVAEHYPTAKVLTPILWQHDFEENKTSASLMLQASGQGVIKIIAKDEQGRTLWSNNLNIRGSESLDDRVNDIPLNHSYVVPMPLRYRGIQFEFEIESQGDVTLAGFAVEVHPTEAMQRRSKQK